MTPKVDFDRRQRNTWPSTWPDVALELVKREVANLSAAQISRKLRDEFGVVKSRCAVQGLIWRKGWQVSDRIKAATPKPKSSGSGGGQRPRLISKPPAPYMALSSRGRMEARVSGSDGNDIVIPPVPDRLPVTLLDLPHGHCKMVVSEAAGEALFCGCPCGRGRGGRFDPYCDTHRKAIQPKAAPALDLRGTGLAAVKRRADSIDQIGRRFNGL